ncbi:hypothetical protein GCM10027275_25000 [Rhabdobacter roseus]|uniref:Protease-4 n=1 Tax=Rhabdobacter roseus TaxID=1655419 RepID=A0A840TWX3_9BACT|nr:S49 family peptidase [Rhabdobacter roseus]MBB5284440.1 protease-4 [Rhabdobacter roseus]
MLRNYQLLTSLLLEPWFVDAAYAEMMFPWVMELLEGKLEKPKTNAQEYEKPVCYFLDEQLAAVDLATVGAGGSGTGLFGGVPAGSTAVVPIRGAITKYDGICNHGVETYLRWVEAADSAPNVSQVALLIDSPGGQANASFMLAERIARMQKPTLAYVDAGMAASAAYLIASAADQIHVNTPVDLVGSIGAMITLSDYGARIQESSAKVWEIYSRLSSEKNLAYRRLRTNNDTSLYEDMLDQAAGELITSVKKYRGDRLNLSAGDPFKGATYSAVQALKLGLIDGIGPLNEALLSLEKMPKGKSTISNTTQLSNQNEETDMSLRKALMSFLTSYQEESPEVEAEATTPEAATGTPAPAATAETPAETLEARLAALEANATELATLRQENANLTARLKDKPAAAPTAPVVAQETVPAPVEVPAGVTDFTSETDELIAGLKTK